MKPARASVLEQGRENVKRDGEREGRERTKSSRVRPLLPSPPALTTGKSRSNLHPQPSHDILHSPLQPFATFESFWIPSWLACRVGGVGEVMGGGGGRSEGVGNGEEVGLVEGVEDLQETRRFGRDV